MLTKSSKHSSIGYILRCNKAYAEVKVNACQQLLVSIRQFQFERVGTLHMLKDLWADITTKPKTNEIIICTKCFDIQRNAAHCRLFSS